MKHLKLLFLQFILLIFFACSDPRGTKLSSEMASDNIEKICNNLEEDLCKKLKSNYLLIHAIDIEDRELMCINFFKKPYKDLTLNDLLTWTEEKSKE